MYLETAAQRQQAKEALLEPAADQAFAAIADRLSTQPLANEFAPGFLLRSMTRDTVRRRIDLE